MGRTALDRHRGDEAQRRGIEQLQPAGPDRDHGDVGARPPRVRRAGGPPGPWRRPPLPGSRSWCCRARCRRTPCRRRRPGRGACARSAPSALTVPLGSSTNPTSADASAGTRNGPPGAASAMWRGADGRRDGGEVTSRLVEEVGAPHLAHGDDAGGRVDRHALGQRPGDDDGPRRWGGRSGGVGRLGGRRLRGRRCGRAVRPPAHDAVEEEHAGEDRGRRPPVEVHGADAPVGTDRPRHGGSANSATEAASRITVVKMASRCVRNGPPSYIV